ncbi:hypothetical protein L1987_19888 [Smallanthus sonchifolius]|uniref:Uncharacterized protein n=1 Tax=Smallanthus sonchifolius TaxID=185202 RepID=A0ACB9IQA6_9ASTR|nr:hypothetical protein L1987_19888 [Smallanthus sonchifolius]
MFPRSKSNRRSRSRANPMFVHKINTGNEANQEPSSPKVTCSGLVREPGMNRITREMRCVIGACDDGLIPESPPRNVFLLTRSRSTPYRCSSVVNRILESNTKVEDDETRKTVIEESEEDEGSINGVEEFKLRRCKSKPARR